MSDPGPKVYRRIDACDDSPGWDRRQARSLLSAASTTASGVIPKC